MGFWKLSSFLALGFLILYQVGIFQAAPISSTLESPKDLLSEEHANLLRAALIKTYMKRMASEKGERQGSSAKSQVKRCNLATCVIDNLVHDLSKFVGMKDKNFKPTNVGPQSYGRRRRDLHS